MGGPSCTTPGNPVLDESNCKASPEPSPEPNPSTCAAPDWKGDGWCNLENNNAGCDYDGGDCCKATCVDADWGPSCTTPNNPILDESNCKASPGSSTTPTSTPISEPT